MDESAAFKKFSSFLDMMFEYIFVDLCSCTDKECMITDGKDINFLKEKTPKFYDKFDTLYLRPTHTAVKRHGNSRQCNRIKTEDLQASIFSEKTDTDVHHNFQEFNPANSVVSFKLRNFEEGSQDISENLKKSEEFYLNHLRLKFVIFVLDSLIDVGILRREKGFFYLLNGYKKFTWKNIKSLDEKYLTFFIVRNPEICNSIFRYFYGNSDDMETFPKNKETINLFLTHFKILFWYLRKLIVDSVLSDIFLVPAFDASMVYRNDIFALSVGSTSVKSDYDITLYGTAEKYTLISRIIHEFNKRIQQLFGATPDVVFDTNLYGISFININESAASESASASASVNTSEKSSLNTSAKGLQIQLSETLSQNKYTSKTYTCNNQKFNYVLPETVDDNDSYLIVCQHVWAFVKVLVRIERIESFDENVYNLLLKTLTDDKYNKSLVSIIETAERFVNSYEQNFDRYEKDVESLESDKFNYSVEDFNNLISFINYNGSETYFCRGTFLDVVVNKQICKNENSFKYQSIVLSYHEYLDSFIENLADFLINYSKKKYLTRAEDAFNKLKPILSKQLIKETLQKLTELYEIHKACSSDETQVKGYLNHKEVPEILKCSAFLLMYICVNVILNVSNEYMNYFEKQKEHPITPYLSELYSDQFLHFFERRVNFTKISMGSVIATLPASGLSSPPLDLTRVKYADSPVDPLKVTKAIIKQNPDTFTFSDSDQETSPVLKMFNRARGNTIIDKPASSAIAIQGSKTNRGRSNTVVETLQSFSHLT